MTRAAAEPLSKTLFNLTVWGREAVGFECVIPSVSAPMGAKPSSEAAEPDHFVDSGDDISVRDGNFSDAGTEITDPMDLLQPHPPADDDTPTCLAQRITLVSSKSCRACEDYAKASVGAMPACAVCGEKHLAFRTLADMEAFKADVPALRKATLKFT